MNQGQSTAITGLPHSGKTSVLEYLKAPAISGFYGDWSDRLIFSYVDAFALGDQCDRVQFWASALKPLDDDPSLKDAYQSCKKDNFTTNSLEKLVAQVREAKSRLVLMIDGFDILLHYTKLNNPEFFGGLRSIASRSQGRLALVITGNTLCATALFVYETGDAHGMISW